MKTILSHHHRMNYFVQKSGTFELFNPLRPNRTIRRGIFLKISEVIPSLNSK
jgi:hypothetical protein